MKRERCVAARDLQSKHFVQLFFRGPRHLTLSNRIHPYFTLVPLALVMVPTSAKLKPSSSEGHAYKGQIPNGAWIDAADLQSGYRLLTSKGTWAEVTKIELTPEPLLAYNLTVESHQTYFVKEDAQVEAIWVHNRCLSPLERLQKQLRTDVNAQINAARTRFLPDGRIRYYGGERPARREGSTRGASYVTEYDPSTGGIRGWMESYDHKGSVTRVHPKMVDGEVLDKPHYPPTQQELLGR